MSTAAFPIPQTVPAARRDLLACAVEFRGQRYWTIKDPVSLRYYQLRDEEHFVLGLLDGRHSLAEIVERFERRFAPRRLRSGDLAGFLLMLHREGLVVASAWGQGEHLIERRQQKRREKILAQWMNVLAIRLPGVNPNRLLDFLVPRFAWLFSLWTLLIVTTLIGTALLVAAVNFGTLIARLPTFHEFFGPGNILWLAAALALVKVLHELGHAVACKSFGGECNRLGVMLLVFVPALYCDVSDAWMFARPLRRIAVSAAGMAVELVLAAVAAVLWAVTEPGWFNALCLNILFVCSVGTLFINGNPLLRYDGYYILADLLGTPNLSQQASAALRRWSARLFAGVDFDQPKLLAEPGWVLLLGYGLASTIYRGLVILAVLWLIQAALAPLGLAVVAQLVTLLVLGALASGPARAVVRFLRDPGKRSRIQPGRALASMMVLAGVSAAVLTIPLPSRVTAPVVLRPEGARQVYVTTAGMLESSVAGGDVVSEGQTLARLHNRTLEVEAVELQSRLKQQRLHVQQLEIRRHDVPALGDQLPAAQEALQDLQEQFELKRRDLDRLVLTAPIAGVVIPPPAVAGPSDQDELPGLTGTPLDAENQGCRLEAGSSFCQIGDPERLQAVIIVNEADVQRLRPGQLVRLNLQQTPGEIRTGRVREVARVNAGDVPPELITANLLPIRRGASGQPGPI
ncbi:MAG TPA: HlyD family efflux transporter periplasmic adaptor subunit, partial [Pirellulaceae bacterium]|nr:HlyD family efflux transporter periplasmic adaptor subunit [Pirellulaceae bacterium]